MARDDALMESRLHIANTLFSWCFFFVFTVLFFWFAPACCADPYLFGVTIDDPWTDQPAIHQALAGHTIQPTARVVFDEHVAASEYLAPVANIHSASLVMGEILDSFYVSSYSVQEYLDRVAEYLDTLADHVDIWEIGNEVNGDWLGNTADVKAKIEGAYALAKNRGVTTAITFYYNKACYYDKPEHEMFTWIQNNVSEELKNGLDYVLFSYYEDDCEGVVYTREYWQGVFEALHSLFPHAKLGFGEIGTVTEASKAEYIQRYYSMNFAREYFVGGYFWWYYKQDCVPNSKNLWNVLETTVNLANKGDTPPTTPGNSVVPFVKPLLLQSREDD